MQPDATARFTVAPSLAELVLQRAADSPARGIRFVSSVADGHAADAGRLVTYPELLFLARRAAARLARAGVAAGDRVLLVCPTGLPFVAALFGCHWLGAVPVPVIPPWNPTRLDDDLARIARISAVAGSRLAVVSADVLAFLALHAAAAPLGRTDALLDSELLAPAPDGCDAQPRPDGDAIALIQFTSGSTGSPKGVVLSHRALLANARAIGHALAFAPDDVCCTWLPLYHDLGLIGHLLTPLAWGIDAVLISPEAFVQRPLLWLETVSRHGCTVSSATNYGYSVCARQIREPLPASIDLSRWRLALCAGEAVQHDTLASFADRFATSGFRPTSFLPCYGLAEFSLAATFPPLGRAVRVDRIDRSRFQLTGCAVPADTEDPACLAYVSVGRAVLDSTVRIVDGSGEAVPERCEGDIELFGPSRMREYFGDAEATGQALRAGWLRTGDRGYLADGELFITGRASEVILVRGRKVYPEDAEAAAASVPGVRAGRTVAFAQPNSVRGTEELVLVCELRAEPDDPARLRRSIANAVRGRVGVKPQRVLFALPQTISKTSSGKLMRRFVRSRYEAGEIG